MINKTPFKPIWIVCFVLTACFLYGCFPRVKEDITRFTSLKKLESKHYPLFVDTMALEGLIPSIDNSLAYFKRVPAQREYRYGQDVYTAGQLIVSLTTLKAFLSEAPSVKAVNAFIRSEFIVYEAIGNDTQQVLFTGYFEPTYEGSLEKSPAYPYPLYTRPRDLLEIDLSAFSPSYKGHKRLMARVNEASGRVVPYYSRQQINARDDFGVNALPLVWLKSRVDRFFLEIQGSGRIVLDQGQVLHVHYAASNGNAYRSIGRYLIDKNEILKENMSMQAIRAWLEQNPDRMDEVLHYNNSFVFFQQEDGGPYGSLGVAVTPLRSIATDNRLFPRGALCFMQAQLPDQTHINPLKEWETASFFVLNQDTGGAIKGPARADLFCGNGAYASFAAGHMNTYGRLFFLVLRLDRG